MASGWAYCAAVNVPYFPNTLLRDCAEECLSFSAYVSVCDGELRVVTLSQQDTKSVVLMALDVVMDELNLDPEDIDEPHYYSHEVLPSPSTEDASLPSGSGVSLPSGSGVSLPSGSGESLPSRSGVSLPSGSGASALGALVFGLRTDLPTSQRIVPVDVPRANTLAALLGSEESVFISRLSIGVRVQQDQSFAWVGLRVWEAQIGDAVIKNLDGHVTLMYVRSSAIPDIDALTAGFEYRLTKLVQSRDECRCLLKYRPEWAEENYAWGDVLVRSALHGALHAVVNEGIKRRDGRRSGLMLKKVPLHVFLFMSNRNKLVVVVVEEEEEVVALVEAFVIVVA